MPLVVAVEEANLFFVGAELYNAAETLEYLDENGPIVELASYSEEAFRGNNSRVFAWRNLETLDRVGLVNPIGEDEGCYMITEKGQRLLSENWQPLEYGDRVSNFDEIMGFLSQADADDRMFDLAEAMEKVDRSRKILMEESLQALDAAGIINPSSEDPETYFITGDGKQILEEYEQWADLK